MKEKIEIERSLLIVLCAIAPIIYITASLYLGYNMGKNSVSVKKDTSLQIVDALPRTDVHMRLTDLFSEADDGFSRCSKKFIEDFKTNKPTSVLEKDKDSCIFYNGMEKAYLKASKTLLNGN